MNALNPPIDILLVEDEEMDVFLFERALGKTGLEWALNVAPDGVEAMDYLRGLGSCSGASRPDLILVDMKMPQKNGREVLAEIRADAVLRSIPVILLSSSDDPNDVVQAYRLGANSYCRKPQDLDSYKTLIKAIDEFWFKRVTLLPTAKGAPQGTAPTDTLTQTLSEHRTLFEHMSEGLAYCKMIFENGEGRDFTYLAVNSAFETLTGLKDVTGKRVSEVIPGIWESDPGIFKIYARVALTGVPEKFETFVESLGMWFSISVYSPAKEFFVAIFEVITQRKRVEAERTRLVTAIEQCAESIIITDLNGTIQYVNPTFSTVTGYSREEVVGHNPRVLKSGKHDRSFFKDFWDTLLAGKHWHGEIINRRKDGSLYTDELHVAPVRDADGKITHFISNQLEVTERKRAEATLRLQAKALEAAANGIVITDREGTIVWANAAVTGLTGYTADELVGKNTRLLKSGRHSEAIYRDLWTTIRSGQVWRNELVNRRKDGSFYIEEMTITPVRDETGEIVQYIAIKQDVTERREAQEEIRKLNEELDQRVRARTVELEAANREMEAFTYSASHDLRAPLRSISGFTDILLEDYAPSLDAEGRANLERIKVSATQMGHLVDGLLKLSRLGRQSLTRKLTPLNPLVDEVIKEIKPQLKDREIEWRIGPLSAVECDPDLMRQVVVNLLSNAVKYTRPRQRAEIVVHQTMTDGRPVYLVRDNGVGFNMEYADKLFGVFQRLHRTEQFEGIGVGLATVQRIIHKHGGKIWAEAEPDKGATFYFTLGT